MKAICLILICGVCAAGFWQQPSPDKDPAAVLELGGSGNWSLTGSPVTFGPTTAVEVTPIENWLELEAGITPSFSKHSTEWDADLLFKKPWTLSEKAEFMFGIGPEWIHTRAFGVSSNALAGEVVLDFMFWPTRKHRFGWYFEPAFDYSFAHGHEKSMGVSGGLLIAIGRRGG